MKPAGIAAMLALCAGSLYCAELKPETVQAFDRYVRAAEARIDGRLKERNLLWTDDVAGRLESVRRGEIAIVPLAGKGDLSVPGGLIHDWVGAVFVPGATLAGTLSTVQDYASNKFTHRPEVVDSRVLAHEGSDYRIYLRVMKKKVLTVVLNTEHQVHYFPVEGPFTHSRSYSTKIAEVEHAGTGRESELPVGRDSGFLWRLNSYWRFLEQDGGVYVECEAISLTRDVPGGLGWLIEPIIRTLPRESLADTLRSTRKAIQARERPGTGPDRP